MNFDQDKLRLDFVKHHRKYFILSGILIGLGLMIVLFMGLNLGVDFEGGTRLELLIEDQAFTSADIQEVFNGIEAIAPGEIILAGNQNQIAAVLFKGTLTPEEIRTIGTSLEAKFGQGSVGISESTVSPTIARELARQAIFAILLASIGVILYVSFRFEYRFAMSAIVALIHDVFIVIAIFSILRLEVDLTFIAAILTIVGYSINDTIVIFDRIRENLRFGKTKTVEQLADLVNRSIVDTLARSINTSLTVVFASVTLFLFGGEGIRNFSFALTIGLLVGAYSSIFIAAQVWMVWKARDIKKKMFQPQTED
jgi:preprotein translocase subunit SecF